MKQYCKAYRLAELRRFDRWTEGSSTERDGDTIVYLWDDLTVVSDPVAPDAEVLWQAVDEDWARFCAARLKFSVPATTHEGETIR